MAIKKTPLISQYLQLKSKVPDAILFFRLGDFYEMFFEDAEIAANLLDLQLTSRAKEGAPLCGVPYHAAQPYIAKLLKAGHKVAICEQEGDSTNTKGLIPRRIVRIITPGTVDEELILSADENNFLVTVVGLRGAFGIAAVDVSTGEFRITKVSHEQSLLEEIARIDPREIIVCAHNEAANNALKGMRRCAVTRLSEDLPDATEAAQLLTERFGSDNVPRDDVLSLAAAMALLYLKRTFGDQLSHLRPPELYEAVQYMLVDEVSRQHLEITLSADGTKAGSLLGLLDRTATPMGGRTLHQWILHPLLDLSEINRRLDAVEELLSGDLGGPAHQALRSIGDLERIASRVATMHASPRDLVRLAQSLLALDTLKQAIQSYTSPLLREIAEQIRPKPELVSLINSALREDSPGTVREGGFIREGFDPRVDELRALARDSQQVLANLETKERERTGISSLKVRFNRVFGYYIEVTRANLDRIPSDYERKQTLVGGERFTTPELKELEQKILSAESSLEKLEQELFIQLLRRVAEHVKELQLSATAVGKFDALLSLATVARKNNYVRPILNRSLAISLREARHPVLETLMRAGEFVPNDLELDPDRKQLLLITGPNMAGKSTFLRQTALVVIMAQMGSFVPATEARIGIVDRIATRIGARDDLRRGESTFMVEMRETARLLEGLSERSLLLIDEVGRGTSTYDGLAIAWALAEHLHNNTRAKILFATHFHELTALSRELPRVRNLCALVREWNGEVIFLRRIVDGVADRSYGIDVARLAGLPESIVSRAREILNDLERGEFSSAEIRYPSKKKGKDHTEIQMELFRTRESALLEELRAIDVHSLTPLEALNILAQLVKKAELKPSNDES